MSTKKIIRFIALLVIGGALVGAGVFAYLFFAPHRNIEKTSADYQLMADDLVNEYLNAYELSNEKYLDAEGESKVLELTGIIHSISTDFNKQAVILLKGQNDLAGVSCTFDQKDSTAIESMEQGRNITVKGVIRSGARYDEDLELYEHVILEKCSLIEN